MTGCRQAEDPLDACQVSDTRARNPNHRDLERPGGLAGYLDQPECGTSNRSCGSPAFESKPRPKFPLSKLTD